MFILHIMFHSLCFKMGQFGGVIPTPGGPVDQAKTRLHLPLEATSSPYLASLTPSDFFLEERSLNKSSAPESLSQALLQEKQFPKLKDKLSQ